MKHYWKGDRVRVITSSNFLEHIAFLLKYDGKLYSELKDFANSFYGIKSKKDFFGAIVTQYNQLGLYTVNPDDTIRISPLAKMISINNLLANDFLEYFLLKFQYPRPPFEKMEVITIPYLSILKILILLYNKDSSQAYLTRNEFYYLFNESLIPLTIESIDNPLIDKILLDNRKWGKISNPLAGTNDLSYDKTLLLNSQFIYENSHDYLNPKDFYIGLTKNTSKIFFVKYLINTYSKKTFNYITAKNSNDRAKLKNQWSDYLNNEMEFFNYLNQRNMLQHTITFQDYCSKKGFFYEQDLIRRFLSSLLAKPFLLLTGISGTGKSKIAELFGEFLNSISSGDFHIKAVGSNWNDNKNLLGYFNPILEKYIETTVVEFIKEANLHPDKTYILLLDEMNLSYTERYFSDFLSALESRTNEITLPDNTKIKWSINLKVIGTINEDETTHTLSPKVIDRANVIEMNGTKPSIYIADLYSRNDKKVEGLNKMSWKSTYVDLLDEIYEAFDGKFGFRIIDEITNYIIINTDYTEEDFLKFFDEQIYQKLLPKLHGTRGELLEKLEKLNVIFSTDNRLPFSARKIVSMINQVKITGFTSFVSAS